MKDLYSYSMERDYGLDGHNALTVLMREESLTLQQAANRAGQTVRDLISTIVDTKAELPSFNNCSDCRKTGEEERDVDKDVHAYIDSLGTWIIGHIYWSFATQRYFGSEHKEVEHSLTVRLGKPLDEESIATPAREHPGT